MDMASVSGFENYYETPYIIWGNEKAKQVLDKDFKGEGPVISPNHLMAELFDYTGWEGNQYMQYISDLKHQIGVNHQAYFKSSDRYIEADHLAEGVEEKWINFRHVEHYTKTNFSGKRD